MKNIQIRPAEPGRDFSQLAEWYSILENNVLSEQYLIDYYEKRREQIIQRVAEGPEGELLGFYWAQHRKAELTNVDLFVKSEKRRQSVGTRLYEDLERSAREAQVKKLQVSFPDTNLDSRAFSEHCGFSEKWHLIQMRLNLETFDDGPYDAIIDRLKREGFIFTSMQELGNTEEAQRKLYALNDKTDLDTPGHDGEHNWDSFEDFQKRVCQTDWYKPGGQMIVIDSASGDWAALSAITRYGDHAYNLHTGVDGRYRGRKLAQAVKVLALRYARDVLKATMVHTDHNTMNHPMIAIDRKFGYVEFPGSFVMKKNLE